MMIDEKKPMVVIEGSGYSGSPGACRHGSFNCEVCELDDRIVVLETMCRAKDEAITILQRRCSKSSDRIAELENMTGELFAAVTKLTTENMRMSESAGIESIQESEEGMVVIGGPHDGKRIPSNYSDRRQLWLPVYPTVCSGIVSSVDMPTMNEIQEEVYAKVEFADRNGVACAWVHPSVKNPMRDLIHGYRRVALR
jgi:hypothetical protein